VSDSSDNLGVDSMKPVQDPEGGYETEPPVTVKDLNMIPVPIGRDAQVDARKMSEVDASGGNITGDGDHDDVGMTAGGFLSDMDVTSLGTEKRRGGWDPLATPSGAPPNRVNTSGTRCADDIKPGGLERDDSLP
jgi:hypothetical protein